jgi:hypothetical protein
VPDEAWAGKTMVQLSSCAPDEAVVMQGGVRGNWLELVHLVS